MRSKLKHIVIGTLIVGGLILLVGTAGASDNDNISLGTTVLQSVSALVMITAGVGLGYLEEARNND